MHMKKLEHGSIVPIGSDEAQAAQAIADVLKECL